MLPPSPPLISPPENLNYVVLITQFMTHFTRPQFMFQWISVAPPAVWICAQQFLGFVFSDFGFIVLVSLTIYFPIGFVSPAPRFPIFAPQRSLLARAEPGSLWRWWKINGFCPIAAQWPQCSNIWTSEHYNRIVCSEVFQTALVTGSIDRRRHRFSISPISGNNRKTKQRLKKTFKSWNKGIWRLENGDPSFECVNIWPQFSTWPKKIWKKNTLMEWSCLVWSFFLLFL